MFKSSLALLALLSVVSAWPQWPMAQTTRQMGWPTTRAQGWSTTSGWGQGQQTTCRVNTIGPTIPITDSPIPAAFGNQCPTGYTRITDGNCCATQQVTSSFTTGSVCEDRANINGYNECPTWRVLCNNPSYKSFMIENCARTCDFCTSSTPFSSTTPSTGCRDQINPTTGRSDCPQNVRLCQHTFYRDLMRTQCPKTCGYCR